jgi:FAD/FMN-containing dehydrogenase
MLIPALDSIDVDALRSRLYGDVVGPDDEGWDEARRAWNLAVDQRPAAVALPLTDSDVVAVVNFAHEEGLRVAPQGTGHGASAIASFENTILLSTKHMRGVRIDPRTRRARVRAGALWADVTAPASAYGPPRWRAPRTTSASSATRSAAASAGLPASTASPATASRRSSS